MFEIFSQEARRTMSLANHEAQLMNHEYLGTEHILLGMMKSGEGKAFEILKEEGYDYEIIKRETEKLIKPGPECVTLGRLPQTPRVKKAIEYAIENMQREGDNVVNTQHILYGLLQESDMIAAQVLMNLGSRIYNLEEKLNPKETSKEGIYEKLRDGGYEVDGSNLIGILSSRRRELLGFIKKTGSPPGEKVSLYYTLTTVNQVLDFKDWLDKNNYPYTEENPDAKKHFAETLRREAEERIKNANRLEGKLCQEEDFPPVGDMDLSDFQI